MTTAGAQGSLARLEPEGQVMRMWEVIETYMQRRQPLVIIAGADYGQGSSRDWAAKGVRLAGVEAIVAEGFERIHRTNLIGMGVLPLQFPEGDTRATHGIDGSETFDVVGTPAPGATLALWCIAATAAASGPGHLPPDSDEELSIYEAGGVLQRFARFLAQSRAPERGRGRAVDSRPRRSSDPCRPTRETEHVRREQQHRHRHPAPRAARAPERVLCLVDPAAMAKWSPPHGFTGVVHESDVRVGGGYRMSFTNFSTGTSHTFGGRYVELVEGERIRYTDAFEDPGLPGEMQVTVTFEPGPVGTVLRIRQEGLPEAVPVDFCYAGWQQSLELLAQLVEADIPDGP